MSTLFVNAGAFAHVAGQIRPKPSITQWQRLESDPVELDLVAGLEARLADPLWLIGRQWQFAELKGENAGMPVIARLHGEAGRLALDGVADPDALPEAAIEAEPARHALISISIDAAIDLYAGLADLGAIDGFGAFRDAFPLVFTTDADDGAGRDFAILFGTYALDAPALAAALSAERGADGTLARLPPSVTSAAGLAAAMLKAADNWLADWADLLVDLAGDPSWQPARLEYATSLSAATRNGAVPIAVPEHSSGRFDWWSMDQVGSPAGSASTSRVDATRLPLPVRFPGMPADRLFEIEPSGVSPLAATVGPTGISAMLLVEYAVAASNDWYQIPLTLPYGTAFQIASLAVTDTFGVTTTIEPAAAGRDAWSMFEVTAERFAARTAPLFLFPAASARTMDSDAIEEVALFRDETANIAWAVERKIAGVTPVPIRPAGPAPQGQVVADPEPPDAALIYRLQTPVPLNWYPLTPEASSSGALGDIVLRLRSLRRFEAGGQTTSQPATALLHTGTGAPLRIEEREIPRGGILVSRRFRFARDAAGRRLVWLGRRKQTGRETASGLRNDLLDPLSARG